MRRVAVGSLGGTITMTGGDGGARPSLEAADLLSGLVGEDLQVEAETLEQLPSASLTPAQVLRAVGWAAERVAAGADGAVLVQGTDTLPESAFLADLYWQGDAPLVLTGAMRLASAASADGPANLRDACLASSTPASAAHGVTVCMAGELHRAGRVRKSHSWGTHAFTSGPAGLAGVVREGAVHLQPTAGGVRRVPLGAPARDPRVVLVPTYLGDDGRVLEQVLDSGEVDGVVVEGFGAGHVPAGVADLLARAATSLPVVVCTSAERGGTLRSTYGFTGSEIDLLDRDVLLGGTLSARQARLLLWGWLAQGPADAPGTTAAELLESYADF